MKNYLSLAVVLLTLMCPHISTAMNPESYHLLSKYDSVNNSIYLKVLTPTLIVSQGLYYERKILPFDTWEPMHEKPVFAGDYRIPEVILQADERLSELMEVPLNMYDDPRLSGLLKMMFFSYAIWNNEYAKFLGIVFEDKQITRSGTYQYRIRSGKGEVLALSDTVRARSGQTTEELPDSFQLSVYEEEVRMWWHPDPKKYYGVNIYRKTSGDSNWIRINQQPFIATRVLQEDGNMLYPDDFYQDEPDIFNEIISYQIKPLDYFGKEFTSSEIQEVLLIDTIPPKPPSFFRTSVNQYQVNLSWENPLDGERHRLHVNRARNNTEDFELLAKLSPHATSYRDTVPGGGFFYYTIASVDKAGNEAHSTLSFADIPDIVPPESPEHISIASDTGMIRLSWSAVQAEDLLGYRIYRTINGNDESTYVLLNAMPQQDTFFIDHLPLIASNPFYYKVVALDSSYNMSDYSLIVSATLPDVTPPAKPFIKQAEQEGSEVKIAWIANAEEDLAGYHLYRKVEHEDITKVNRKILPPHMTLYFDTPEKQGIYSYYLTAEDKNGNASDTSNPFPLLYVTQNKVSKKVINDLKIDQRRGDFYLQWSIDRHAAIKGCVVYKEEQGYFNPVSGLLPFSPQYRFPIDPEDIGVYFVRVYMADGTHLRSEIVLKE